MGEVRDELEAAILARLEAKSDHMYQWPRWAASYEASMAALPIVERLIAKAVATAIESQAPLRQLAEAHAREAGAAEERERAQFNDEVRREQIRMARAEAWDEGWHAAEDFAGQVYAWNASEGETEVRETTNPYRTGTANAHL